MQLGIAMTFAHHSPEEWAEKHRAAGLSAVVFPLDYRADIAAIDAYVTAAKTYGLRIAEVGTWCNVLSSDTNARKENLMRCIRQLELAEYIRADCCVNIAGTTGEVWDGSYSENYTQEVYEMTVNSVRDIIDAVRPRYTCYSLEPMPHMIPDSPESYLQLMRDIDRSGFGVHLDVVNMITSPRVYFENRDLTDRCFALLGPAIRSCHVKDAILDHGLTVSIRECACGEGGFDISYYLQKINAYHLPVIIEHLAEETAYRRAIDVLGAMMGEGCCDGT